jgi:hypothetical protein
LSGESSPGASSPAATPSPSIRSLAPVARVRAACPLLSAEELKALLGSSNRTALSTKEDKPERSKEATDYLCEYGSAGNFPFALDVSTYTVPAFTPKMAVDAAGTEAVKRHRVSNVGSAAVFVRLKDNQSMLSAAKRSHGQTRMVLFVAPSNVPGRKFIQVTKLVLSRI